jgi:hypothetical protein
VLIAQLVLVTVLFVVFLVVWYRTDSTGWRALTGGVLTLAVLVLMVSTFSTRGS